MGQGVMGEICLGPQPGRFQKTFCVVKGQRCSRCWGQVRDGDEGFEGDTERQMEMDTRLRELEDNVKEGE